MKAPRGFKRLPPKDLKVLQAEVKRLLKELKAEREKQGFTQESFAEELNISYEMLTGIERGKRMPSLPSFVRIARVLGLYVSLHKK